MSDCVCSRFPCFRPSDWADTQVRPYVPSLIDEGFSTAPPPALTGGGVRNRFPQDGGPPGAAPTPFAPEGNSHAEPHP